MKFAAWLRVYAVLCETAKQAVNLSLHQDPGVKIINFIGLTASQEEKAERPLQLEKSFPITI
jgi:hypothetical protein